FLALDPFVSGGAPDFGGRYVHTGFTMEYQPETSTELKTVNSRQTTIDHQWSTSITFGIHLGGGLPFSPFKIDEKMTLSWSGLQETTGQQDQSADVVLKTSTPNAAGVFDVYFDNMFNSFLFVPTPPPCIDDPVTTTCAGKQCGLVTNNCGKAVTCPNTCAAPATCGGGGAGPNSCGCTPDPIATTCAGKQSGPATNNCGQAVACPDTCAPGTCGVGTGPNSCGCISTGNPCGTRCGGTMTDNCGNVFTCHASCGLDGQCPLAGGTCNAVSHTCV